jgi:hypothetical protein
MSYLKKRVKTKSFAFALVFATVLSLCAGFALSAQAAVNKDVLQITKLLRVPEGQAIPNMNFQFKILPVSVTTGIGEAAQTDPWDEESEASNMPSRANVSVGLSQAGIESTNRQKRDGVEYLEKLSANIVGDFVFNTAGSYLYLVSEVSDTYVLENGDTETISYATDTFNLRIIVAEKEQEEGLEITSITSWSTDPTKVGKAPLTFINDYSRIDQDAVFTIGNRVVGTYANTDPTNTFEFWVTILTQSFVPIPEDDSGNRGYKAYITDGGGLPVTDPDILGSRGDGSDANGTFYLLVPGEEHKNILLGHQEHIRIDGLPTGSRYTVTEKAKPFYRYSLVGTVNSSSAATDQPNDGYKNQNQFTNMDLKNWPELLTIRGTTNGVVFYSNADEVPDTGLSLKNLPYIGLVVLGTAALGVYGLAAYRRRKAAQVVA